MNNPKCNCGCGREITNFNRYGCKQKYIHGHNRRGYTKMYLTKEQLEELYIHQRLTTTSISNKVGLSQGIIYDWLKRYGIKVRTVNEASSKKIPKDELIKMYINNKFSTVKIANILNVSQCAVHRWIKEYNIPIRSMSEAKKKIRPENELIYCSCGCNKTMWKYDSRWIERKYRVGHGKSRNVITKQELNELYTIQKLNTSSIAKRLGLKLHTAVYRSSLNHYGITIRFQSESMLNKRPKNELKECACGCKQKMWRYDKKGRERLYIYSHINKLPELRKKYNVWNKDKTFEEMYGKETAKLKRLERKYYRSKQIFPVQDTKIEVKIQMFLKELGYEFFTHQYIKDIEHGYQCDILIPSLNLVIECDGDYWHKYPIGTELDHIRTKELIEKGFKVLRLWEFEIKKMNKDEFELRLKEEDLKCQTQRHGLY